MEVSSTPMPEEYRDYKVDILCKDCHEVRIKCYYSVTLDLCALLDQ